MSKEGITSALSMQAAGSSPHVSSTTQRISHPPSIREDEHGHSICRIHPMTHHTAESVSAWFNGFFTTVIGIATLGASITFSYVIGTVATPPPQTPFGSEEIQVFLGISWLLFLLALAFASLGSTMLTFFKDHWRKDWNGEHGKKSQTEVQLYATFATGLLGGLVVAAFVFLCLVIVAFTPIIGWISLGFTTAFGGVVVIGVAYQAPWPWQVNQPKSGSAASA